ncbi:MAG: hypothetical protein HY303_11440 [Candidatus Wallbacteria bacterium]|nr:hypothetical protein [Candidatus Wallbacteria bacterium]
MRSSKNISRLALVALALGAIAFTTGCDDPMSSTIKGAQQAEADKAKAETDRYKAQLQAETDRQKLDLEREKERNRANEERHKDDLAAQKTNGTSGTVNVNAPGTAITGTVGGTSTGEQTKDATKPTVDEGAALGGGSKTPAAPATGQPAEATKPTSSPAK